MSQSLFMAIDFERQQFFFSRVQKKGEHLLWRGANTTRGYGKIQIDGENQYVHRVAWCIKHNLDIKDIDELVILRICEENACVEPTHLIARKKKSKKK